MKALYEQGLYAQAASLLLGMGIKAGEDAAKSDTNVVMYSKLSTTLEHALTQHGVPVNVPYSKETARQVAAGQLDTELVEELLEALQSNPTLAGNVMTTALNKLSAAGKIAPARVSTTTNIAAGTKAPGVQAADVLLQQATAASIWATNLLNELTPALHESLAARNTGPQPHRAA